MPRLGSIPIIWFEMPSNLLFKGLTNVHRLHLKGIAAPRPQYDGRVLMTRELSYQPGSSSDLPHRFISCLG